jgi:hypothetical protein
MSPSTTAFRSLAAAFQSLKLDIELDPIRSFHYLSILCRPPSIFGVLAFVADANARMILRSYDAPLLARMQHAPQVIFAR